MKYIMYLQTHLVNLEMTVLVWFVKRKVKPTYIHTNRQTDILHLYLGHWMLAV